jgi:hypothetical protein
LFDYSFYIIWLQKNDGMDHIKIIALIFL